MGAKKSKPPSSAPGAGPKRHSAHPAELSDDPVTIAPPSRGSTPPPVSIPRDEAASLVLRPLGLVARARFEPKDVFVNWFEGSPVLLVRLDAQGLLAAGLSESDSEGAPSTRLRPPADSLSYATTTNVIATARERSRRPLDSAALLELLKQAPHYIVLLQKRRFVGTKPFAHRISVGRARNNDIVLRHPTVSKFHAWFECDEDDAYFLCDAKSKNETLLNDKPLRPKEPVRMTGGDRIRFGSVVAFYSKADMLWDAISAHGR